MSEEAEAGKDRTWAVALAVFLIAFHFALVCFSREYALWKAGWKELYLLQNEKTDFAVEVVQSSDLFRYFILATPLVLGLAPFLIQRLRCRLWIRFLAVFVLYLPGLWYGQQVILVQGKLLDWNPIFEMWKDEATKVEGSNPVRSATQQGQPR